MQTRFLLYFLSTNCLLFSNGTEPWVSILFLEMSSVELLAKIELLKAIFGLCLYDYFEITSVLIQDL